MRLETYYAVSQNMFTFYFLKKSADKQNSKKNHRASPSRKSPYVCWLVCKIILPDM